MQLHTYQRLPGKPEHRTDEEMHGASAIIKNIQWEFGWAIFREKEMQNSAAHIQQHLCSSAFLIHSITMPTVPGLRHRKNWNNGRSAAKQVCHRLHIVPIWCWITLFPVFPQHKPVTTLKR